MQVIWHTSTYVYDNTQDNARRRALLRQIGYERGLRFRQILNSCRPISLQA